MTTPAIDWAALTPILVILAGAVLGVLVEAFVPRRGRRPVQITLSLLAVMGAILALMWRWTIVSDEGPRSVALANQDGGVGVGTFIEDFPALGFQMVIAIASVLSILVIADRTQTREGAFVASAASEPGSGEELDASAAGFEQTEVFPLALFSTGGMLAFASAGDLLTMFVSLEVFSLPLYVLCATARRRRLLSQEAALKYFVLGAFSSAFFLMGVALLYGFSGTLNLRHLTESTMSTAGMDYLLIAGVTLVSIGLLFKVGAAPFHSWTPDTYQGAPTPITGFMAAGTKTAAFAAMLRFMYLIGGSVRGELQPVFWIIIIATITIGTVGGIVQGDIKRMLAYSSISHAGFVLIGVIAFQSSTISSVIFYMLSYGLCSIGAFAIITLVRETDRDGNTLGEATALDKWKGLGKRNPLLAGAMTIFLLSFAGIPLTGGFLGKFVVFSAGYAGDQGILVVIAVVASAATAFFYFRLIQYMFFKEPEEGTVTVASEGFSIVAILVAAAVVVLLGVVPGPVVGFIEHAAAFML